MQQADIVIVGLGTMGSMALWQSALRGRRVLGIEQYGRIHTNGAYAGESRLFRVAAKEGDLYTPALLEAHRMWLELGEAYGSDILLQVGALSIGPKGFPDLEATMTAIIDHNLPHRVLDADELRRVYPQFAVEDGDIGILDELGGGLRPEVAVAAATDEAAKAGAEAWYHTEVAAIESSGDGVVVRTTRGDVEARRAIVTAGPWTSKLMPQLADLVRVRSFALTWCMPRHIGKFDPARMPGFMRDLDGVHAFGVPTLDGYSIKICPHFEFDDAADMDAWAQGLDEEQLAWMGEQAQRMVPDLIPAPSRWSVHPDSMTPNKMPIIDTVEDGRIAVATGMSGNGFKFAPVYGRALAELAETGKSRWRLPEFTVAAHPSWSA